MIAIEIRVNGELKATCGTDDLRQLAAMLSARRSKVGSENAGEFSYHLECMGVRPKSAAAEDVLRWVNTQIGLGDEVTLKFVEAVHAQAPFDRQDIPARNASDS
jgi:hypothetical protein